MARSVRDIADMLEVLAGADRQDARLVSALPSLIGELGKGVDGLKCALSIDLGHIKIQPGIEQIVRGSVEGLQRCGMTIEKPQLMQDDSWSVLRSLNHVTNGPASAACIPFIRSEEFIDHCRTPENHSKLTDYGKAVVAENQLSDQEYRQAKAAFMKFVRQIEFLLTRYDVLLTPTMPCTAPLLPAGLADPYPYTPMRCGTYFTALANIARLPAASIPCGMLDGLPVGLQVIAPFGREDLVLRVCQEIERFSPPPGVASIGI